MWGTDTARKTAVLIPRVILAAYQLTWVYAHTRQIEEEATEVKRPFNACAWWLWCQRWWAPLSMECAALLTKLLVTKLLVILFVCLPLCISTI